MAGKQNGWVMGTPVVPPPDYQTVMAGSGDRAYSNPNPNPYVISGAQPAQYTGSTSSSYGGTGGGNPYVQVSTVPPSADKSPMNTVLKALGRCSKTLEVTTRKATGTTVNVWQHLKTSPNLTEAAMSKLAQGTKIFAEGGKDKIFHQTFGTLPQEQLRKSYACYLSTSSGPVIGTLYLSTARLAFCSDNPLSHNNASNGPPQEVNYYKVVVPLDRLRAVNPSASAMNPSEKYIQVVTADGHDFWFMGFVSYDKALMNLTEALRVSNPFPVYS
ncbi:hypothetical protein LUZ60_014129 [Juncus effusus]|nr:hypothetical protein LUZ60_014129 [Juncus effusus]